MTHLLSEPRSAAFCWPPGKSLSVSVPATPCQPPASLRLPQGQLGTQSKCRQDPHGSLPPSPLYLSSPLSPGSGTCLPQTPLPKSPEQCWGPQSCPPSDPNPTSLSEGPPPNTHLTAAPHRGFGGCQLLPRRGTEPFLMYPTGLCGLISTHLTSLWGSPIELALCPDIPESPCTPFQGLSLWPENVSSSNPPRMDCGPEAFSESSWCPYRGWWRSWAPGQ